MKLRQILAGLILLAILAASFTACEKNGGVPDGIYSCIAADTGEMYTFSGRTVRVTLFIMGNITENHEGTYRLENGVITMDFPTDAYGLYSGSFSFSAAEDGSSITIGDATFKKEAASEG